jgi:oxygen-independent coproporphyrinogen-3 oxidase
MHWKTSSPLEKKSFDPAEIFAAGLKLHHIANTAYPIGHTTTMQPYRVPNSQIQDFAALPWQDLGRLGLYVHIPFCEARCGFCEYTVVDPATNDHHQDIYFDLLLKEFDLYARAINTRSKRLIGFDIGGGTPSLASTRNIARILNAASQNFQGFDDIDVSIETTPKIAAREAEKMRAYKAIGIQRISMGVQTINHQLLARYGRSHTALDFNRKAVENIRAAGFEKFNIDLMYGFARQTVDSLKATLEHVFELQPDFITLYRMRYKGTRVAAQAETVSLPQVNQLADFLKEMLQTAGYRGSPGKNTFSRVPGDVGTSDYLSERVINGTPYLGLGLGAQSLSQHSLAYNSGAADKQIKRYRHKIESGQLPIQDLYHLSKGAAMAKMLSVSFYFGEINLASFQYKFGVALEDAFPAEVAFLLEKGLMVYAQTDNLISTTSGDKVLRLTANGEHQVNGVIPQFYNGEVKAHLLKRAASQSPSTPVATRVSPL